MGFPCLQLNIKDQMRGVIPGLQNLKLILLIEVLLKKKEKENNIQNCDDYKIRFWVLEEP